MIRRKIRSHGEEKRVLMCAPGCQTSVTPGERPGTVEIRKGVQPFQAGSRLALRWSSTPRRSALAIRLSCLRTRQEAVTKSNCCGIAGIVAQSARQTTKALPRHHVQHDSSRHASRRRVQRIAWDIGAGRFSKKRFRVNALTRRLGQESTPECQACSPCRRGCPGSPSREKRDLIDWRPRASVDGGIHDLLFGRFDRREFFDDLALP